MTIIGLIQTNIHRKSAPYTDCLAAVSATPAMDVYTELYPVSYDHLVSIKVAWLLKTVHQRWYMYITPRVKFGTCMAFHKFISVLSKSLKSFCFDFSV